MYGVREAVIEKSWMEPLPIIFKDLKTGGRKKNSSTLNDPKYRKYFKSDSKPIKLNSNKWLIHSSSNQFLSSITTIEIITIINSHFQTFEEVSCYTFFFFKTKKLGRSSTNLM